MLRPRSVKNLRVLVAHNTYQQRGGEDALVESEASLLRAHGHPVEIYLRHNDELLTMSRLRAAKEAIWSSRTQSDLASIVDAFKPDVVHAHNTFALISPSLLVAAARARIPVVQTLHNFRLLCLQAMFTRNGRICQDCLGRLPWRGVVRRCYRGSVQESAVLAAMLGLHRAIGTYRNNVTRYIALSDFSRATLMAGGLPGDRISVKPNAVDIQLAEGQRPRSGALFVGRLSSEKGTSVLARAAAQRPAATIDVMGVGPEQSALEGVPGIRLLGWQDREAVHARMREAVCLVFPSIGLENCPLVVVEAFACGLPVIASRLGALVEMVRHGETGLLCEPGNVDELVKELAWAEANPEAMARMGRAARREYEKKYSPAENYEALMRVYQEAMDAKWGRRNS